MSTIATISEPGQSEISVRTPVAMLKLSDEQTVRLMDEFLESAGRDLVDDAGGHVSDARLGAIFREQLAAFAARWEDGGEANRMTVAEAYRAMMRVPRCYSATVETYLRGCPGGRAEIEYRVHLFTDSPARPLAAFHAGGYSLRNAVRAVMVEAAGNPGENVVALDVDLREAHCMDAIHGSGPGEMDACGD